MGANTKISWCDHTWNPWRGCIEATLPDGSQHPGCGACYAKAMSKRNPQTLGVWGATEEGGVRVMAAERTFNSPLKWQRETSLDCEVWVGVNRSPLPVCGIDVAGEFQVSFKEAMKSLERLHHRNLIATGGGNLGGYVACQEYSRPRVFVDSLSDAFEDWQGPIRDHKGQQLFVCSCQGCTGRIHGDAQTGRSCVFCLGDNRPLTLNDLRARVFSIIDQCPCLDFLILTKRPANVIRIWPPVREHYIPAYVNNGEIIGPDNIEEKYRSNVWLLYSASDQASWDAGKESLKSCRDLVPVLGCSAEPLTSGIHFDCLDPPDMTGDSWDNPIVVDPPWLDWVITGGESGPHARPHDICWSRNIGQQCQAAGVAWFHKQHGSYAMESLREDMVGVHPTMNDAPSTAKAFARGEYGERIKLKDRAGADPSEWGDGWLQQIPEVNRDNLH